MFRLPETMDPEEYKQEWLAGMHQTEYNACRFADDKTAYGEMWLNKNMPNVDFKQPRTLVDRICHCKLYDKNILKQKWADKICSHWNLYEMNMPELCIEPVAYSRCHLTDADWRNLPNGAYIIKMTHGSGWNIKFQKTEKFDPSYIQKKVWEWYNLNFAYITGYEWQYENVQPGWVIQPDFGHLMNWEFWCEDGKIIGVNLARKHTKNIIENVAWCDENGERPKWTIGDVPRYYLTKSELRIFNRMKPYVLELAKPFKFVRADLYHINNEIKFSELTFTPSAGRLFIEELK